MTDEKTRTIRRWNDLRIGENPIRAFAASNQPHKKAAAACLIPTVPQSARCQNRGTHDNFRHRFRTFEPNTAHNASSHSERPSALNQVNDQDNDRNHEQQMDQSTAHVTEKTEKPENDENHKYSPQHRFYFRLISSQSLCPAPQQKDEKQNRNGNSKKPK